MRLATLLLLLLSATVGQAADLNGLPANTWVEIKYTTEQPADPACKGAFARQLWNKLVYDPDGQARPLLRPLGGQEARRLDHLRQLPVRVSTPAAAKLTPSRSTTGQK